MCLVQGIFFSYVMRGLNNFWKTRISIRLAPIMLYFIPAMSVFTPFLGFALSLREKIFTLNPLFISIITISIIVVAISFIIIVPAIYNIYKGFKSDNVDESMNGKLLMRIAKAATVQMVLQISIISLMAYIVVFM